MNDMPIGDAMVAAIHPRKQSAVISKEAEQRYAAFIWKEALATLDKEIEWLDRGNSYLTEMLHARAKRKAAIKKATRARLRRRGKR